MPIAELLPAESLTDNTVYQHCLQSLQADTLVLPTIPDIAVKIRRAINNPHTTINQIARIVQIDPSITARLIHIANSPLYCGRRKTESCPEALTRLGLNAAQDIITALALKSVFTAKTPHIRQKMQALWEHCSYVAAISMVLAHKTPGFDPDRAMLAGLIHDIGIVPIFTYADTLAANPDQLSQAAKALRTPIGVEIITRWDFPEDFADIIRYAEDWFRKGDATASYSDVVMMAQLHSFIGKVDSKKLPKFNELPAYYKLVSGHMDVETSLNIMDEARDEIEQIRHFLH
ncbi:HDOD domain-containing protein [Methylomonas sp. AM2-LC]|uniref:HDOD domain-containing protein n=1 Tax=Methylomonas sp. AM2-LC TaxID=3153301 RepID=UPI0032655412